MSPEVQTTVALGIVALATVLLLWSFFRKDKSHCGDSCGAITPEIRDLKARIDSGGRGR